MIEKSKQIQSAVHSKSTISDPKDAVLQQELYEQKNGKPAEVIEIKVKFANVDGERVVVHERSQRDTLMNIALKYSVTVKQIMNLNKLVDDQIFHLKEIYIPIRDNVVYVAPKEKTLDDKVREEQTRRSN